MKKIMNLFMAVVLFAACSSDKLDTETALKLLQDKKAYPKVLDEEIYTADPEDAKRILDSGLEKEGLLKVQRTQELKDIREHWILQGDNSYKCDYFHFKLNEDETLITYFATYGEVSYDVIIDSLYENDEEFNLIKIKQ